MKVMLTKGWGRLDNVVSEVELDNPTTESIQDAIANMYAAYMGLHFNPILFGWEMYERCAIIGFGSGEFYGAIPDCPEELFPKPQQFVVIEKEKFDALLAKAKEIADEMRGFKRYATSDSNDCRYVAYWMYQTFADRIDEAIKEFEKGETNA